MKKNIYIEFKEMPFSDLLFDTYTDPINEKIVSDIVNNFDDIKLEMIKVSLRKDDKYYVYDGKNRIEALKRIGYNSYLVQIYKDMEIAEEIESYTYLNTNRRKGFIIGHQTFILDKILPVVREEAHKINNEIDLFSIVADCTRPYLPKELIVHCFIRSEDLIPLEFYCKEFWDVLLEAEPYFPKYNQLLSDKIIAKVLNLVQKDTVNNQELIEWLVKKGYLKKKQGAVDKLNKNKKFKEIRQQFFDKLTSFQHNILYINFKNESTEVTIRMNNYTVDTMNIKIANDENASNEPQEYTIYNIKDETNVFCYQNSFSFVDSKIIGIKQRFLTEDSCGIKKSEIYDIKILDDINGSNHTHSYTFIFPHSWHTNIYFRDFHQ